jgi:hypothetical protein
MSSRKTFQHLSILAGLALGGALLAPSRAAADEADDGQTAAALIIVHGSGEVRVHPDSLNLDVGVEARANTVDQARTQVNGAMRAVLAAVHALDVPGLTIDTKILQLNPVYATRRADQPPAIVGYTASNHATITVVHLPAAELGERASKLVDTAVTAGANSVGQLGFFLADPTSASDQALAEAVRDARRQADTIATAAGVHLGDVFSVEQAPVMRITPRAFAMAPVAATPVEVDDIVVDSSVTARYTFH